MDPTLDPEELRTLRAALDRIVPADDFPGATEAGCDTFILRLLATDPVLAAMYESGLAMVRDRGFADLSAERQDQTLRELEAHPFVQILIVQAIEGYYADPANGGNRDSRAWEMVGFRVNG